MSVSPFDHVSQDTIIALSSGALPSGVAVVRVSGPSVRFVLETTVGTVPSQRNASLRVVRRTDGTVLDEALVLFFAAPASFTGEDVAEFQLHGGRAVVAALLEDVCALPGCRLAEAGEFTRRAFANGKLDLLSAEAAADLVAAETEAQRRFAVAACDGRQAALYDAWRERVLHARALIEAELDFSDQEDVSDGVSQLVWDDLAALVQEIDSHVAGYRKAEILRSGYRVVLVGAPNAGKSSILNALARRDVAIVTDEAGTTRDALDVRLDLNGVPVTVTDTAGIRTATSKAEQIGVERSHKRARDADLILEIVDATDGGIINLNVFPSENRLCIANKIDLVQYPEKLIGFEHLVSAATGHGIDELLTMMERRAKASGPAAGELLPWRERHVGLLTATADHLRRAINGAGHALELRAEELRLAGEALGRIAGRVDVEDLLGAIFSRFCVGK